MPRRTFLIFLITLAGCAVIYLIFIQKPPLGDYLTSLLQNGKGPFANLNQNKKEIALRLPILMYHYVEDVTDLRDTLRQSMATRPSFFEEQLRYLKNNDYAVVTLDDLYQALKGQSRIPEKSIILTFDDGYRDFYTDAYPLLKKYQMKAINYIIVNHIGRSGNLTEEMIKEMLSSGLVQIGCHTLDHVYLPKDAPAKAKRQIVDCKKQLEERFGVAVNHFAYPGGYYNSEVMKMVEEAGFNTAVATVPGIKHSLNNIFTLKRLRVGNLDSATFGKHLLGPKEE